MSVRPVARWAAARMGASGGTRLGVGEGFESGSAELGLEFGAMVTITSWSSAPTVAIREERL